MNAVTIQPIGEVAQAPTGATLLSVLLEKKLQVQMSCGARGVCATCHIRVNEGMERLSPMNARERRTLNLVVDATPQSRLACQSTICGSGIEIEVPEGMYLEKADDLLSLLGKPAAQNIKHPVTGAILIPKGKLITRTMLEQSRGVERDLKSAQGEESGSVSLDSSRRAFTASGVNIPSSTRLHKSHSTHYAKGTPPVANTPAHVPPPAPTTPTPPPTTRPTLPLPTQQDLLVHSTTHGTPSNGETHLVKPKNPAPPKPGSQIGKYLLMECVGKGGTGLVYRALHTKLHSTVAVKFIRPDVLGSDPAAFSRLGEEARMLAQLIHPNVVRVLDFEDDPQQPYVVMEFIDGLTGSELIRQSGRLTPERAIRIVLDVTAGLEAGRSIGIVHRDVKPGNFLITRDGMSKLADLGLAMVTSPGESTIPRAPEGTVGYMAPEVIQGNHPVDHLSDIYSLGATLFHFVTGRLPFPAKTYREAIFNHLTKPLTMPDETPVPEPLWNVIVAMMAKEPSQRPRDYHTVRTQLMEALNSLHEPVRV